MVSYDPFLDHSPATATTTTITTLNLPSSPLPDSRPSTEPAGPILPHEFPSTQPPLSSSATARHLPVSYDQTPHACPCCLPHHEHSGILSAAPPHAHVPTTTLTLRGAFLPPSPPLSPPLYASIRGSGVSSAAGWSVPPMYALE